MFRDNVEVALNQMLVQCEANARRFRYTAEILEDDAASRLLQRLAGERDDLAIELSHWLRSRGELPDTIDVERQTLQELRDRITTALTRHGRHRVLQERVEEEEQLASAAAASLDLGLPEDIRPLLERVRKEAETGAEYLRTHQEEEEVR